MTPADAKERAKRGDLLPFYLVVGDEDFLRDQVLAAIREACLAGGVPAFNEDKFTAGEVDVEKVIAAARTVPMMAPRRFVLLRGLDRWDAAAEGKEMSPLDRLAEYATSPVNTTCVVAVAAKLDGRRKLSVLAKKQDFIVNCESLDRRALPGWIEARARSLGHTIDEDATQLLAELVGPELAVVADAIERLSLYVGANSPITEQAVSTCITKVRTADTWALVDAVGARDLGRALRILQDVYDARDRGLPLLGALAWSVRQLFKFKEATASGSGPEEAARMAGAPPFRARDLSAKVKAFRGRELDQWLLILADTDVALKSSRRPADAVLEDMLTRLCRRAA